MPQRVQVNSGGLGTVEFPEMMPAHEMASHINRHLANTAKRNTGPEMHAPTSGDIQANLPGSAIRPQTWWEKISGDIQESPAGRLFKAGADIQNRLRGSTSEILSTQLPYLGGLTVGDVNDLANAVTVFHGSPHVFDKFDTSKIGTGEGAQVYGHGLYFAENPKTAEYYQHALSDWYPNGEKPAAGSIEDRAAAWVASAISGQFENPYKEALAGIERHEGNTATGQALKRTIQGWRDQGVEFKRGGHVYSVDLPDEHAAKMLDWDKPLSEQSTDVIEGIDKLRQQFQSVASLRDPTGAGLLSRLSALRGEAGAAQLLHGVGILGIKYLDQASRNPRPPYTGDSAFLHAAQSFKANGQPASSAMLGLRAAYKDASRTELQAAIDEVYGIPRQQTRNFVVFDPAILGEVTRK